VSEFGESLEWELCKPLRTGLFHPLRHSVITAQESRDTPMVLSLHSGLWGAMSLSLHDSLGGGLRDVLQREYRSE